MGYTVKVINDGFPFEKPEIFYFMDDKEYASMMEFNYGIVFDSKGKGKKKVKVEKKK